MARGYPDYTYFSYPLGVFAGGTGTTLLTNHGVVIGQGTAALIATAAGNPYDVLQVPVGGGDPAFGPFVNNPAGGAPLDLSGSDTITVAPPAGSTNLGWKATLYGSAFALGLANSTVVISTGGWVSVFNSALPPANDATGAAPDTHAKVTFGNDGSLWADRAVLGQWGSKVGIGINGASELLHVYSSSANTIILAQSTKAGGVGAGHFLRGDANGYSGISFGTGAGFEWSIGQRPANSDLHFYDEINAKDVLTILQGGYVGIGTTSPQYLFHLQPAGVVNAYLAMQRGSNTYEAAAIHIPFGALAAGNPEWASGLKTTSADYQVWGFDGSTTSVVLRLELDGHVTFGGVRIAPTPTAGQVLIASAANAAAWTTPDGCRLWNSGDESIPSGAITAITFDTERYDNGNLHDTGSNTSRITAQKDGVYAITGAVCCDAGMANSCYLRIRVDGATDIAEDVSFSPASARLHVAAYYRLQASHYVELTVLHGTGVAKYITHLADTSPVFTAQWVGPYS